jgi:hypothetical protein
MNIPPATVSDDAHFRSPNLTEEEENGGCQQQECWLPESANQRHEFKWALGRRDSRSHCEIGEYQSHANKKGTNPHRPREAHLRDEVDEHDGEDHASE